jgi:hypothetical protein
VPLLLELGIKSTEKFRRRTQTQAIRPGQHAVVLLLFGLLRNGQIKAA